MMRLREITEKLEKNEATLDEAVALFTEGASLSAYCYEILRGAELKITEISVTDAETEASQNE